jgi:prepilin-type N-terminal cleavage/methylation domain-containing protein
MREARPVHRGTTLMRRKGFTLIELMIVVAILSVLAVVAGTAFRKYMDSARTTEAYYMLGEIRNREEAYRAEFSQYLPISSSADEGSASFFPAVDLAGCREPCPKDAVTSRPTNWVSLGINPGRRQLYCGYDFLAGAATQAVSGTQGTALIGATQTTPWWYAIAICDNDGNTAKNATFVTAYSTTVVTAQNEHN